MCGWWCGTELRLALLNACSSHPRRDKAFSLKPGRCRISERTHLPRTKQILQRFFPISDSKKMTCPFIGFSHSQPVYVTVVFQFLVFQSSSFLFCLSVCLGWFASLCLCRVCVLASVCPSLRLGGLLSHLSLLAPLLLTSAEQVAVSRPSLELTPRDDQCWI